MIREFKVQEKTREYDSFKIDLLTYKIPISLGQVGFQVRIIRTVIVKKVMAFYRKDKNSILVIESKDSIAPDTMPCASQYISFIIDSFLVSYSLLQMPHCLFHRTDKIIRRIVKHSDTSP